MTATPIILDIGSIDMVVLFVAMNVLMVVVALAIVHGLEAYVNWQRRRRRR